MAVLLGFGGWGGARLAEHRADLIQRKDLLSHAAKLARTVHIDRIDSLAFTPDDLRRPQFERLRGQILAYAEVAGLHSVYCMALRDDAIVFGPDNQPADSPIYTPPGTVYKNPPPGLMSVFVTGFSDVVGPYADEFGSFMSAFVPIVDPLSEETVLVVGVDVEVSAWMKAVGNARSIPMLFALAMFLILCSGIAILEYRRRLPSWAQWRLRHVEAALCVVLGTVLTAGLAWASHGAEIRRRRDVFASLAQACAHGVSQNVRDIRETIITASRFFQASDHVGRDEFSVYTGVLAQNGWTHGWTWIPEVAGGDRDGFVAQVRAEGFPEFDIWELDEGGVRRPAAERDLYRPSLYIEPFADHSAGLGHDMASEPRRRAAIEESSRTGLSTASDPIRLIARAGQPPGVFVFMPTSSATQTGHLAAALGPRMLAASWTYDRDMMAGGIESGLFQLSAGQPPELLTGTSEQAGPDRWGTNPNGLKEIWPVFAFGKTYALMIHPTPAWLQAHPLRAGPVTLTVGLLLTVLLTALIAILSTRRTRLERLVEDRTAELSVAHENMAGILNAAPVAMLVFDSCLRVVEGNREALDIFGGDPARPEGLGCGDFLKCAHRHDDERGCGNSETCVDCDLHAAIRSTIESGAGQRNAETEVSIERQGRIDALHFRFSVERVDYDGRPHAVMALHDITALRQAEERYRTLFREMVEGFALHEIVCDEAGRPVDYRFLDVNPAFEAMVGRTAGDLIGRTVLDVFPGTEPYWIETYGRIASSGEPEHIEHYSSVLDKFFEVSAFQTLPGCFACLVQDVTSRWRVESRRELAVQLLTLLNRGGEMRAQLGTIRQLIQDRIGAAAVGIRLREGGGEPVDALKTYAWSVEVALRSGEETIGLLQIADTRAGRFGEEDVRFFDAIGASIGIALARHRAEARIQAEHGEAVRLLESVEASRKALVSIMEDQKRSEKERELLRNQLLQSQKMEAVGRLAGGVAHDFNNMLQVILGRTEVAMDLMGPENPVWQDLDEVRTAAKRSAELTRQLLAFARKQTIQPRVIDLNDEASGSLKMIRRLIGENIDLVWKPVAVNAAVYLDPAQLDQILANLTVNARDAIAGTGTVVIETMDATLRETTPDEIRGDMAPGEYVVLVVSDNGSGMDRDILARIFEPFFTTKPLGEGTGLGLATVHGIVNQNGGTIHAYSEPGRGSTFKIYFPRVSAPVPASASAPAAEQVGGAETLLLVEDEASILSLAGNILRSRGYTVLSADSPANALTQAEAFEGTIHLLVTDVVMPGMSGKALRDRLVQSRPNLPTLFISGYTANVIVHHGVVDETVDFLQKPFSGAALAAKVREVLDRKT